MAKIQHGLGKGLGALLGGDDIDQLRKPLGYINKDVATAGGVQTTADVLRIPVSLIEPNPYQPRTEFDPEALQELSDSIRTYGLIQPITVRKTAEGKYQIISGERRFRASQTAGLEMVPCYVRTTDDRGMLEMAIVENIQREDLDPIEVALGYQRLIEECDLTQEQMAERVGKNRVSVTNQLRLLRLPDKIQHDLKAGLITVGHAKVLLGVNSQEDQEALCDQVIRGGLSVRQLEERIRRMSTPAPKNTEPKELPHIYYRLLEKIGRYFGDNISLKRKESGRGTITIKFESDAQMAQFLKVFENNR